jgi:dsRNA-specific ribonuclease
MSISTEQEGIYLGSRGDDFKCLIESILKMSNLKSKYISLLLTDESMYIYGCAFTSEVVDPVNNYQVLEQIGDLSGNKFIVSYIYNKFPKLNCAEGVKIAARLRINYGSKQSFAEISRKIGFWPFISATNDLRQRKMKPLLEDVFEAFLGATETILDKCKMVGVGYAIVYSILEKIFDGMNISLKYEDLYDAKTRLKELFDIHETKIGPLIYKETKDDQLTISTVYRVEGGVYQERLDGSVNKERITGGKYIKIGEGSASLKSDAQQKAAEIALKTLATQGIKKHIPEIYKRLCGDSNIEINVISSDKKWGDDINCLKPTKEKTKYQNKYQSTPISMYCRQRNITGVASCIDLASDPNIVDTDGMTSLDLLFIGKIDDKIVSDILNLLLRHKSSLVIHRQVFEMYYSKYTSEYFGTVMKNLSII